MLCWGRLPFAQRDLRAQDPSALFAAIQEEPLVVPAPPPAISSTNSTTGNGSSSSSCGGGGGGSTWEAHHQAQWWLLVAQLQRRLLQKEPSERLQLWEVLCHPWLGAPISWRQVVTLHNIPYPPRLFTPFWFRHLRFLNGPCSCLCL